MTEIVDLWPDTIKVDKVITPYTILRQQASLLGKKTNNLVQGEVESGESDLSELFYYDFYIVAPALNNYRYCLLSISYNIGLYPVAIKVQDQEIIQEISKSFEVTQYIVSWEIKADSQDEFLDILKAIFNSSKVMHAISVLISQSEDPKSQSSK